MTTVDKSTKKASTFDPRYIPGCTLWLDATDLNTLFVDSAGTTPVVSPGDTVGLWKDKSDSVNNATASTNRPFYNVSGTNVKTIRFSSASSTRLSLTPSKLPTGTSSFTMFIVSQITGDSGSDNIVICWGSPTVDYGNYKLFYSRISATSFFPAINVRNTLGPGSSNGANIFNSLNLISDKATSSADAPYLNGTAFSTINSRSAYNIGTTNATIGAQNTGSFVNFLSGYVGEIIFYNRSVTDTERIQVEGYLASKWGLSSLLPSTSVYSPSNITPKYRPSLYTFSPKNISGCVCWFDASDRYSFTLDGSSNVTSISDKSGGVTKVDLYGTLPWSNSGLGSNLPAFDTNIGAFVATISPALSNFTNTTFIVTKLTSTPPNGTTAVGLSTSALGSPSFYRALDYSATTYRSVLFAGSAYVASLASSIPNNFLFTSSYSGTSPNPIVNYLNGGSVPNGVNSTSIGAATSAAMIGCDAFTFLTSPTRPSSYWANGKISEVIIFNSILSDNDRNTIEGYLAHKWKLNGNLPSTHIYKNYYPLSID